MGDCYETKVKVQWLNLGDANIGYLFAHMKSRLSHNTVTSLTTAAVITVHSQEAIEKEVVSFYQGLLGQDTPYMPSVDTNIIRRGGMLHRDQELQLGA